MTGQHTGIRTLVRKSTESRHPPAQALHELFFATLRSLSPLCIHMLKRAYPRYLINEHMTRSHPQRLKDNPPRQKKKRGNDEMKRNAYTHYRVDMSDILNAEPTKVDQTLRGNYTMLLGCRISI